MPGARLSPRGALSTVGTLRNFMSLVREMSFDEEREQAERMPRLLIMAPDTETGRIFGDRLTGSAGSAAVSVWTLDAASRSSDAYDIVIVHAPAASVAFRQARNAAGSNGAHVFETRAESSIDEQLLAPLRRRIATDFPDLAPALGRWFPAFRPAATSAVINETSRVNAQFALVANVPSAIPIIGSIASAGADFFVLSKNQVMMVFKLAAINGRDLNDQWAIVRELLPVVGAGFLWRTLAREAASFLPFMAGTVPKVAIAFTGTMAAGRAADFYYRIGRKPDRAQLKEFYVQAAESLKRLPVPIYRNGDQPTEPIPTLASGEGSAQSNP